MTLQKLASRLDLGGGVASSSSSDSACSSKVSSSSSFATGGGGAPSTDLLLGSVSRVSTVCGLLSTLTARFSPAALECSVSLTKPALKDRRALTCRAVATTKSFARIRAPDESQDPESSLPRNSQAEQPVHHVSPSAGEVLLHLAHGGGAGGI